MFQNIILLAAQQQQHLAIAALFKEHNPDLTFTPAITRQDLEALDSATLSRSRLISFTSGTIVPAHILNALGHGAYNMHPGSPEYPGWAPAHFAIYDGARSFGATAHLMTERVDDGPIVGVEKFIVPNGISVRGLEQMAYVRLAHLLWSLSKPLATQAQPLPSLALQWGRRRSTRRMYAAMCEVPSTVSREELHRRVRAFHDGFRGMAPTVTMHDLRFRLVAQPSTATSQPGLGPTAALPDMPSQLARRA